MGTPNFVASWSEVKAAQGTSKLVASIASLRWTSNENSVLHLKLG